MRIVVTGGTGFIGRALVAALVSRGDDVCVITREPARARAELQPRSLWRRGRPTRPERARAGRADAVVHLAGEGVADGRWTERAARADSLEPRRDDRGARRGDRAGAEEARVGERVGGRDLWDAEGRPRARRAGSPRSGRSRPGLRRLGGCDGASASRGGEGGADADRDRAREGWRSAREDAPGVQGLRGGTARRRGAVAQLGPHRGRRSRAPLRARHHELRRARST